MNFKFSKLWIIKELLKIGSTNESNLQNKLKLTRKEYNEYHDYALKDKLSKIDSSSDQKKILEPTTSGISLRKQINQIETESPDDSSSLSKNIQIEIDFNELLKRYILVQAEIIRVKVLLNYDPASLELAADLEEYQDKKRRLKVLISLSQRM
jgi:hypothetical protein